MNEWKHALLFIEMFLSKKYCINPVLARMQLNCKAFQLKLAIECGMQTPETVISNDSTEILCRLKNKSLIYKTLSSFVAEQESIFTNKIDENEIIENSQSIFLAPGIFQELVEKDYELRITIVGEQIFVVKVNSQEYTKTQIDWRHDQREHMFSLGGISLDTKVRLLQFHKKAGLIFATYDFIVDKNGNEIFLECNPSGQWLFVGNEIGSEISHAIAKIL
jgi:glutathione synthase/RimK-type ligase-like ATP-grasp enzyme